MKKLVLVTLILLSPLLAKATPYTTSPEFELSFDIPIQFSTSGETKTLDWGCPIDNEQVEGENKKSVVNQLISQCIEQVSRAAKSKPDVIAVLQASVIAPDLAIQEERKGLHRVNGTIFLQTIVSMNRGGK
ncbi:MAG: hypothetical protein KCHDKBKB_00012 [Elusimicrobia bacterium]|nr:hypothetical protein [Elusimicrobiota bacterium]